MWYVIAFIVYSIFWWINEYRTQGQYIRIKTDFGFYLAGYLMCSAAFVAFLVATWHLLQDYKS